MTSSSSPTHRALTLARRAAGRASRLRWAGKDVVHELAARGLFDLEYYRAQFPRDSRKPETLDDAVAHYASTGRAIGLAPSPFLEPEWWDRLSKMDESVRLFIDTAVARGWARDLCPSPILCAEPVSGPVRDVAVRAASGRWTAPTPSGLSAQAARRRYIDRLEAAHRDAPNRGSASAVDWSEVTARLDARTGERISVLVPTFQDWQMTATAVRAVLDSADEADVEVVIVENGSRPAVLRILVALFIDEPRVKIVACEINTNFAGGMNRAIAESTGEFILLLNNDAIVEPGWWAPLRDALSAGDHVRGAQPLLLYPDIRRIQAAGTMFLGEGVIPWHFLAGHPVEDLERVTDLRFKVVTAAILALRARDVIASEGFDEGYANGYEDVDLCLRMLRNDDDYFVVVPESRAVHPEGSSEGRSLRDTENRIRFLDRWRGRMPAPEAWRYEQIGLRLAAMRPHWFVDEVPVMLSDPQLVRPARLVEAGPAAGLPCLRWTLALTSPADESLVQGIRAALLDLGQEVVSFSGGVRFVDGLDDVLVAFDQAAPYTPRSATFNVLVSGDAPTDEHAWNATIDSGSGETELTARLKQIVNDAAAHRERLFGPA